MAKHSGPRPLNNRELKFIDLYLRNGNAYQAAVQAGYSKRGAARQSYELLQRPAVKAEIERLQLALREKRLMSISELFEWSCFIATCDLGEIYKPGTFEVLPLDKWPDERLRKVVERVKRTPRRVRDPKTGKTTTTTTVEVAIPSRNAALERIARMLGVKKGIPVMDPPIPMSAYKWIYEVVKKDREEKRQKQAREEAERAQTADQNQKESETAASKAEQ